MMVYFSRHAKRRCKLYKIDAVDVENSIIEHLQNVVYQPGHHEIVIAALAAKYKFPLKIVFEIETQGCTVITAYPLKKSSQ